MKVRRWVQCDTSLPDDGIEDKYRFIQLPGKNVTEAMLEVLEQLGCKRHRGVGVEDAGDLGWLSLSTFGKVMIHCQVTMIDYCVVLFEDMSMFRSWFKIVHPQYLEILLKIADALPKDGRFSNVRWYDDADVEGDKPGAAGPVD